MTPIASVECVRKREACHRAPARRSAGHVVHDCRYGAWRPLVLRGRDCPGDDHSTARPCAAMTNGRLRLASIIRARHKTVCRETPPPAGRVAPVARGPRPSDVQRLAQRAQAGFVEGLAQRRMGVDGAADIFQPRAHLEREAEGGGEFRHAGADGGDAEDAGDCRRARSRARSRPPPPSVRPGRWPGTGTARHAPRGRPCAPRRARGRR